MEEARNKSSHTVYSVVMQNNFPQTGKFTGTKLISGCWGLGGQRRVTNGYRLWDEQRCMLGIR